MEWDGSRFTTAISAPRRDKDAPSWELVVSIMRNSGEIRRDTDLLRNENSILKRNLEDARLRNREWMEKYHELRHPKPAA